MSEIEFKEEKGKSKSKLNTFFSIAIPLTLGVIILYFLYKDTNFSDLWVIIKEANWAILTFSLIFGLAGNVLRGLRWELLIKPLGYTPKKLNLIYAVLGNYAVNIALPRAGEVWRCGIVSKTEKIPFKKLIGSLLLDRVFDAFMVVLILLITFICNIPLFLRKSNEFNLPTFTTSAWFYISILAAVGLFGLIFFLFRKNKIIGNILDFAFSIWNDIKAVQKMKEKKRFIVYSFGIWISYFLYFYVTFFAFHFTEHLGIAAGLFTFAMGSISMVIPSNGGLGPWQAAIFFALVAFMVEPENAKAFATAVFAFQSIWVVACGLFGIVKLSLNDNKIQK